MWVLCLVGYFFRQFSLPLAVRAPVGTSAILAQEHSFQHSELLLLMVHEGLPLQIVIMIPLTINAGLGKLF